MNKLILISIGAAIAFSFAAINYAASSDLRKVQSGEVELVCVMKDGERVIDGGKVNGRIDGKWTFDDGGYAGNCEVIRGGEL